MASGAGGIGGGAGGGGGGGKIPRRRCHQRSTEPYQQAQGQGILSRVTEPVKNIVPQWLQSYFSRNEDVCSCSTARTEPPQCPVNQDENVINDDEESADIHDGRITPEPTVSNMEDHSGLNASNCLHMVTSPAHQSHLNSMLESPVLDCQPSTSSAFPSGSSGFSKEMKDSASQHDDDNISTTTSDFSSRVSAEDIAASKNTSVSLLQPVETEHCHLLSQGTATSSRKQAFNESVSGTLSSVPVRREMEAQQLNEQSCGLMSSTAQQMLLQCLEKMSSPLLDAKRIPCVSSPLNSTGNETNTPPGQSREQQESGVSYPNVSMSAANGLPSGVGNGGGKMRRERSRFVTTKPLQKKAPVRRQMKTKQLNMESCGVNSLRARRISQCLEKLSNPLLDALSTLYTDSSPLNSPLDRSGTVTTTDLGANTQKVGVTFSEPVAKTAELSESSSISEPITNSSGITSPKTDSLAAQPTTTGPAVSTRPGINSLSSSRIGTTRLPWQRDPYLYVNKVTGNNCIVHQETKLPPSDTAKQAEIGTPRKSGRPTLRASGTGCRDKIKPAVGTWNCDTCSMKNKPEVRRCVGCETLKRGICFKRVLTLPVASERAVTMAASSSSCTVTTGALGLGNKSEKLAGYWQCPVCSNYNNRKNKKCATCICEIPGSSFVFATGPSALFASPFYVNQTATFGQSQGAGQPNPPGFGYLPFYTVLVFDGCRSAPPALGTMSSSSQSPVFGQQPGQSAIGPGAAPTSREQNLDPSMKGSQHFI
ncbi:PREDICTED: nuclear pore complex protein Nup153-like [Hipposideros armiger]|uniref:Nuclear pore complex protein Nup153 n=1 Tax=Hipposideros armiger TaxID=186990 RepID=A0A8B7QMJ6_HIPAR|nr:PREDICTED: nuclear pore complex protein Nup153-like [Hipposideros armiger]